MKSHLLHGLLLALAGFLLALVLFITGLGTDQAKFELGQRIAFLASLVLATGFIVSGVKTARDAAPADRGFTYGQAAGAGVLIQMFASLFGLVTSYLYFAVVNPGFSDLLVQLQLDKLQARGISGDKLDRAEHMLRLFTSPLGLTLSGLFSSFVTGAILALVIAGFFKRRPEESANPPAA